MDKQKAKKVLPWVALVIIIVILIFSIVINKQVSETETIILDAEANDTLDNNTLDDSNADETEVVIEELPVSNSGKE